MLRHFFFTPGLRNSIRLGLFLAGTLVSANAQQPSSATAWVEDRYPEAISTVFKDICAPFTPQKGSRWTACIVITPSFRREKESILFLQKDYDNTVRVRMAFPQGQSIYDQLIVLRREHSDLSLQKLCQLVRVQRVTGDQTKIESVRELANNFESVRLPLALSDELIMDPVTYHLKVRSSAGAELDTITYGSGTKGIEVPGSLLGWESDVQEFLAERAKV
jgi:hypothetical protein